MKGISMRSLSILILLSACGDDSNINGNVEELITTVTLDFVPMGGGATISASFDDLDGDGGDPPTIDPINLVAGTTYTTAVRFLNKLETPPEEITDEVSDEGEDHQVFFTGTAINGPATDQPAAPITHSYLDMDINGFPLGLSNRLVAARGTGTLIVTLRHMPPINGNAVKTADSAATVKASGFAGLGGASDASVTFTATVP
jgi:hypothetical protein